MIIKICFYFLHSVLFILSLLLVCLETTSATSLIRHQFVAVRGGDANGVINKCNDKETHALLDFKARLEDPDGLLFTWKVEDDCCEWSGVTCNNQTSHVTKLDLSSYFNEAYLGGEISHSLLNLSYLNHLDLSYNYFHGTIHWFVGSMTQLRYLDLHGNRFSGTIPMSIGSMTQLRYLDLGGNHFNGIIPPELGNLTNLRYLSLGSLNKQNCTIENLDWLSHLSHLQQLDMDGISLAKANHWVNVILSLRKLSYLSLWGCHLSQVMYPYSSSFVNSSSSIVALYLGDNNLNSSMYHWLFPLTSNRLVYLDLSYNMLDGIPKYLGNLCSLTSLEIYGNSAVVEFPDFLNNLSGCTSVTLLQLDASMSQFTGSLPDEIQKFSSLENISLFGNQLNGTISEKVWELPKLFNIDLSNNSLEGVPSKPHMSNISYVDYIDLSSCKLGPRFPNWIQSMKNLTHLNLANTRISNTIRVEFWDMWPSQLNYLNLSSNNISGKVPDLLSNFDRFSIIDLSLNNFYGPIPNVSSTLVSLNLSRNKFYGGISFLCQIVDGFLSFLDLSHNSLIGQLPDCLWHFKELIVLNLEHNNLSGRLPASLGSLIQLEALYLYNNSFSGELPLALKNCTRLNFLNLGANKFFGKVPVWIGENLSGLYALSLRSNNFFGPIPLQLCQLVHIQILDLSMNNLYGTIPSCVNNLTTMVQEGFSPTHHIHYFKPIVFNGSLYHFDYFYFDHGLIEWQGNEREFSLNQLGLLKSIDLSSNNLTGQIPYEVTNLYELLALNLSSNDLQGEVPRKIGQMKKLLILDLSRNTLSGELPSSMSILTSLNYLDVSYNNLSGRIPTSTQLQSFEPSRYTGNAGLCGPPLTKPCPGDEVSELQHVVSENEGVGEDGNEFKSWFYIGGGVGFATGFWIACSVLLLKRQGRHAVFRFLDSLIDWIYVRV